MHDYTIGTLIYDRIFKCYGKVTWILPNELNPKFILIKWSDYEKESDYSKGIFDQMLEAGTLSIVKTEDS